MHALRSTVRECFRRGVDGFTQDAVDGVDDAVRMLQDVAWRCWTPQEFGAWFATFVNRPRYVRVDCALDRTTKLMLRNAYAIRLELTVRAEANADVLIPREGGVVKDTGPTRKRRRRRM